jgi:predicted transcriptional regulator
MNMLPKTLTVVRSLRMEADLDRALTRLARKKNWHRSKLIRVLLERGAAEEEKRGARA